MVVDKTNLYSESHKVIKDLLKSNLTDPKGRHKVDLVKAQRELSTNVKKVYPYVVLNPLDITQENESNDGTKAEVMFTATIEVLARDNPDLDTLSDDIREIFNSSTHKATLRTNGLEFSRPKESPARGEFIEGYRVYVRVFTVTFMRRMSIT